jgi:hypothetical protein
MVELSSAETARAWARRAPSCAALLQSSQKRCSRQQCVQEDVPKLFLVIPLASQALCSVLVLEFNSEVRALRLGACRGKTFCQTFSNNVASSIPLLGFFIPLGTQLLGLIFVLEAYFKVCPCAAPAWRLLGICRRLPLWSRWRLCRGRFRCSHALTQAAAHPMQQCCTDVVTSNPHSHARIIFGSTFNCLCLLLRGDIEGVLSVCK